MLPTLTISPEERASGRLTAETLSDAQRRFFTSGTLVLEQAFPADLIEAMRAAFMERYARYLVDERHDDALEVGDKRFMLTLDLEPPFDPPSLYANAFAGPVMAACLGPDHIMGSFGAVVSLPDAKAQHVHRDFSALFPEARLDELLPAYAITLIVPLVDVDETIGTTLVWPGSHRVAAFDSLETPPEWPVLARGDCLFVDYRLVHGGSANLSRQARPIVYNVYSRPWFRDHLNYSKQPRMRVSREALARVPDAHRHLFAHAVADGLVKG